MEWLDVGALDDLPELGARVVKRAQAGLADVAIFRSAGAVFALEDRCPHKGGPLSQGIVFGGRVACPLHNWNIELATGAVVAPDVGQVKTWPLRIENGRVLLAAEALAEAGAEPAVPACPVRRCG
uniref:nitrite reductase small subunit NirD n=1 Tax=Derxia lacustris TaxID=764842 RepID=UPI000A1723AD